MRLPLALKQWLWVFGQVAIIVVLSVVLYLILVSL